METYIVFTSTPDFQEHYTWPVVAKSGGEAARIAEESAKSKCEIVRRIECRLEDGQEYWLGAVWGKFNQKYQTFSLGNCYVNKCDTVYKDCQS